jgi:elongation factor Ts
MEFTAQDVKQLRELTGAGFADCRAALAEASSFEAAVKVLEEKGQKRADKVKGAGRETTQGVIVSYIHHGNNLGVLLELNCSTDFVARNDEFRALARELAIQVAGLNPEFISFDQIPAEVLDEARRAIADDPEVKKRPLKVREQVIDGKLKKQFSSKILLEQVWLKDPDGAKTIAALIDDLIRKTGENITVRRFTRYALGE